MRRAVALSMAAVTVAATAAGPLMPGTAWSAAGRAGTGATPTSNGATNDTATADTATTSSGGPQCRASTFHLEPLAQARRQAKAMVARMTLDQEVDLMHGAGAYVAPARTAGATRPVARLHIPALTEEDGPGGVGDATTEVTQLPAPAALAATFDPAAAACYGQVIGTEARGKGINLVYGPTINIVRVPQWGRAFETLGEDPVLTGDLAAAEVRGIQRTGTMAQVKHYAVYNQETNRNSPQDDAVVGQQALQEIYLRAWDQVVTADPSSVMCSYAIINGTDACQDKALIDDYLDTTLGFPGFVGSDWFAVHSTVAAVDGGLDQEQPGASHLGKALVSAVHHGRVTRTTIDQAVERILTQMYRFRLFTDDTTGRIGADVASTADAGVAEEVAEEGTTLLKDAGHILPLAENGSGTVAVIGPAGQADPVEVGGGSATVIATNPVTPLAGIEAAVGTRRPVTYTAGLPDPSDFTPIPPADLVVAQPTRPGAPSTSALLTVPQSGTYELAFTDPEDYVPVTLALDGTPVTVNASTPPNPTYTATVTLTAGQAYRLTGPVGKLTWATPDQITTDLAAAVLAAATAATAVVVVGDDQESEAADRLSLSLPADQDQLVAAVAAANPHTVVVVDAGGPVTMPWLGQVAGVLDAWYPGQADGTALAAVLFGATDPSGHLPMTFPTSLSATPVSAPARFPGVRGRVHYAEGVDVGYRWYDATGTVPLFRFGYGLSYTTFGYLDPSVRVKSHGGRAVVTATVRVTNTGQTAGADVAQLYLAQPAGDGDRPRQLEAFRRVALEPGRSTVVRFTLSGLQLASYDTAAHSWVTAAGRYRVFMGDSSALAQLPARASFRLTATWPDAP